MQRRQASALQRIRAELTRVAEEHQLVPGTGERDVQAALVLQQAPHLPRAADEREEHDRALAALEAVDILTNTWVFGPGRAE